MIQNKTKIIAGIVFSGICWYLSNGLYGDNWYLLWVAPIFVLLGSLYTSGKKAFLIAFSAYLIGRLSWFNYLVTVATLVPALFFTLLLPLIFAFIILVSRKLILRIDSWYSIFVFPVLFTAYEFLLISFSPDGSAASIAYSQSNILPIIQIASFTGSLGITFLVTLLPSAVAIGIYYRLQKFRVRIIAFLSSIILLSALIYGILRMQHNQNNDGLKVGLVVLEEKLHNFTDQPVLQKEKDVVESYVQEIKFLAAQGSKLVILPERAININKEIEEELLGLLSAAARQNKIYIVAGYTNFRNKRDRNSALVINEQGQVISDYNKVHLVTGFERQFTPGKEPGLYELYGIKSGIAICKDLDFPGYIKEYGRAEIGLLAVPAWDFIKDEWLHSRMAVLRGVECGFSVVRTARTGRLTISDCTGRVLYEADSSNGMKATLNGEVPIQNHKTLFVRFGNWFGILNSIALLFFIFAATYKKTSN